MMDCMCTVGEIYKLVLVSLLLTTFNWSKMELDV